MLELLAPMGSKCLKLHLSHLKARARGGVQRLPRAGATKENVQKTTSELVSETTCLVRGMGMKVELTWFFARLCPHHHRC